MTISYTQTDRPASCAINAMCSRNFNGGNVDQASGRLTLTPGVRGTSALTETLLMGETSVIYVMFEIVPTAGTVWNSGNWAIRLNVTSPSNFITWVSTDICQVNGQTCLSKASLGSLYGQAVSLRSAGVKSMTVVGSAVTPDPGDKVEVLLGFSNSSATSSQSFGYTPDQLIDSPFSPGQPKTHLLIFNNAVYESADSTGMSWVVEPFPAGGPSGGVALTTTAGVSGWVLDNSATVWQRVNQSTFAQLTRGDLSPTSFDFYSDRAGPGATVVGNIGAVGGQQSYVSSIDGGNSAQTSAFGNLPLPAGSTLMRLWADERRLSIGQPFITGVFLAQVRDSAGVDHLYRSGDLANWTSLTVKAPTGQASLLVAAGLISGATQFASSFNVGPTDNWFTISPLYQATNHTGARTVLSTGSTVISSTGPGAVQTTQFTLQNALPGTHVAVQIFAILFDSPGVSVNYVPGQGIRGLGGGGQGNNGVLLDYGNIVNAASVSGMQLGTAQTQGPWSFLFAGVMGNANAPNPTPAGTVYQLQWTNSSPAGWSKAIVLSIVLDFDDTIIFMVGSGMDNAGQGQGGANPITVLNGTIGPRGVTGLQLMLVLTDGIPSSLSDASSNMTVPTGGPDPLSLGVKNIRGDFIQKQNGTYLVAADLLSGISSIARSTDSGVTWTFNALPNSALPTRGLVECDDGTVLVPTDGSAGPGLVFRSTPTDDGRNFQAVQFPAPPAVTTPADVYLKYFPIRNRLFAYVSQRGGGTGTTVQTAAYRSVDQGQSWGTQPVFTSWTSAPLPQQSTSWMALTGGITFWGVDSTTRPNTPFGGSDFYTAVKTAAGRTPAFWGRYIGHSNPDFNLRSDEVTFLHDPTRNCKILLIYAGVIGGASAQMYQDGVTAATSAINLANQLGVPSAPNKLAIPGANRVWIYLDTEINWSPPPTADFFRGWSDTMFGSNYGGAGGVYGNTDPTNHASFNDPYSLAYVNDANMRIGSAPALVYANQPNLCAGPTCTPNPAYWATTPPGGGMPTFSPYTPQSGAPTVVYQYAIDLTIATQANALDFDLTNGAGYASMW